MASECTWCHYIPCECTPSSSDAGTCPPSTHEFDSSSLKNLEEYQFYETAQEQEDTRKGEESGNMNACTSFSVVTFEVSTVGETTFALSTRTSHNYDLRICNSGFEQVVSSLRDLKSAELEAVMRIMERKGSKAVLHKMWLGGKARRVLLQACSEGGVRREG